MGLIHDVSTGMEGLVKRGNLGGLIVNVAHGLSDTAAKVYVVLKHMCEIEDFSASNSKCPKGRLVAIKYP